MPSPKQILPAHADILPDAIERRKFWKEAQQPEQIEPAGPQEESVWDYPRPPIVRATTIPVRVEHEGRNIAETRNALNIVEKSGGPVHYIPPDEVDQTVLIPTGHITICEWKGAAVHYDLHSGSHHTPAAAFVYPDPLDDLGQGFGSIAGYFAFYPSKLACYLGDERVKPQPGGFYAGWLTSTIKGPVKGVPGSENW